MFKKFQKGFLTALVCGGFFATPLMSTPAVADTSGGTGAGCVNTGCTMGPKDQQWEVWTSSAGKKDAYAKFKADAGRRGGNAQKPEKIDRDVNARVPGGVALCKKSDVVWAIMYTPQAPYGGWFRNLNNATHKTKNGKSVAWGGRGTIESPVAAHGGKPSANLLTAFKDWDKNQNGHRIDKQPGYVIICSGNFEQNVKPKPNTGGNTGGTTKPNTGGNTGGTTKPNTGGNTGGTTKPNTGGTTNPPKTWTTTTSNVKKVPKEQSRTGVYACTTQVTPQITKNGIDPIGANNLHPQTMVPQKTNFGNLVDKIQTDVLVTNTNWDDDKVVAKYIDQLDAALAKDSKINCNPVDLDAPNREGIAEGGVLNVTEQKSDATVSFSGSDTVTETTTCTFTQKWNQKKNAYDAPTKVCDTTSTKTGSGGVNFDYGVTDITGFWQMIGVRCNETGFKNLMNAVQGEKIIAQPTDPKNGTLSFMAHSKKYNTQPDSLDFGDKYSGDPAIAASGEIGFYDKECSVVCLSDKNPAAGGAIRTPASKNVEQTRPANGSVDKGGALSGSNNTNKFTFFRDNKANRIDLDVWYPERSSVVKYDGALPLTTTFSRWSEGTPSLDGSSGGQAVFSLDEAGNQSLFNPESSTVNEQKTGSNSKDNIANTSATVPGLVRTFWSKSTWASENDRPHVFNVKWEYRPVMSSNATVSGIGFDKNGNAVSSPAVGVNAPTDVKCYANFGKSSGITDKKLIEKNTGTGVENNLDGSLVSGDSNTQPVDDDNNLFIRFVRSTTE